MKDITTKILNFLQSTLGFILGLNFFGFGILAIGLFLIFIIKGSFWTMLGMVFIGFFIGKNAQAIKEHFDRLIRNS